MRKSIGFSLVALTMMGTAPAAWSQELNSVGVTVGDLGNPFFVQIGRGAELAAKEINPDAEVTVVSSGYDLNRQVGQIDDFIAAGVDMIVLNAADSRGISPAVRRAKEAGIVVVAVDVNAEGADATVTSNNVQAGEVGCEYLAERLGGEGNVVIINGPPVSAVADRVEGCQNVLAEYEGIEILSDNQNAGGSREGGLEAMTSLLTAFPDIDAVFAINDPTAIGADLAAKQAQRDEFFIVGVDGAPDAEAQLAMEDTLFVATAAQDPLVMAQRAVEVGYDIMQGNPPAEDPILIPVTLVTKDNLDEYAGWTSEE